MGGQLVPHDSGNGQDGEKVRDPVSGLNLSDAAIIYLPPSIGIFVDIVTLNVSKNKLVTIPKEIGKLVLLEKLDLSNNQLNSLPKAIGRLHYLKELDIHNNNISVLPNEIGRLCRMDKLRVDSNPITTPPYEIISKDVKTIVHYLRDHIQASGPPRPRQWTSKQSSQVQTNNPDQKVKVMCYNVLAPSYANASIYPHCPSWALDWTYRSNLILQELITFSADVICLQEVEVEQFENLFVPELAKAGYEGIHQPKSRYNTMSDEDRRFVDGCAIFWRSSKFQLHHEHVIDFVECTMARSEDLLEDHDAFNRLISKDNIGLMAVLEVRSSPGGGNFPTLHDAQARPQGRKTPSSPGHGKTTNGVDTGTVDLDPSQRYLVVCNTHIHWNPEFQDVKLMQSQLFMEEIQKVVPASHPSRPPVIICGDYNSTPDSGVYEFMAKGQISSDHKDFGERQWGAYSSKDGSTGSGCRHQYQMASAYAQVKGKEPEFSNSSFDFRGCLSYLFYTQDRLRVNGVLDTITDHDLFEEIAMPNSQFPSDHISLFAEFTLGESDLPHPAIANPNHGRSPNNRMHRGQQGKKRF